MDKRSEFIDYVRALVAEGGTGNRLVVSGGHGWAVLTGQLGGRTIDGELATSAHLPQAHKLSTEQVGAFGRAGFVAVGRGTPRRHKVYSLTEPAHAEQVVDELTGMMGTLYGTDPAQLRFQLALEDASTVENPKLIKAMRKLSKVRSHEARVAMYQELVNATLLLAVDGEHPRKIDALGEWDVFGVFTDDASVRHFDPRGVACKQIYGHLLFPMLMRRKTGSLKINPDGLVGGELYRNELETLARAVSRFGVR